MTRRELLAAGLTASQIRQRLARGTLLRVHQGVYRAGHRAPSLEARYLAAVRSCGPGAALGGPAAGHLLGLVKAPPAQPHVVARSMRLVPGLVTRRCRRLGPTDVTLWLGIPVTTVPVTLVDLAGDLPAAELARACHEAAVRYGVRAAAVEAVLARRPNSPGAWALRRVLRGDERVTLSVLEKRFLDRLREARLPLPRTNRKAGAHWVDCRWPRHRLTVEVDSYRFHSTRHAWEQDRRREREAYARGDAFRRYTYGDVYQAPALMLAELRALLG